MVNEETVRKWYQRYQAYWDFDFPEVSDVDFVFARSKDEWGSVTWLPDGDIRISFDSSCRKDYGLAKATLAHEMNHVANPKIGHGKKFNAAMLEALNRGLVYESLI